MSRMDAGYEESGVFFEEGGVAGEGADEVLARDRGEGC